MPAVFNAVIYYLGNSIHTLSKKTHTHTHCDECASLFICINRLLEQRLYYVSRN